MSSLVAVRIIHPDLSTHTLTGKDAVRVYDSVAACSPWVAPLFVGLSPDFTLEFVSDKPRTSPLTVHVVGSSLHRSSRMGYRYCVLEPDRAHQLRALGGAG